MKSLRGIDSRRLWLVLTGLVLVIAGFAARRADADNEVRVIAFSSSTGGLAALSELNPYGLYSTGQFAPATGTKAVLFVDLLPYLMGGDLDISTFTLPNDANGASVNGAGQIVGSIGDDGFVLYSTDRTAFRYARFHVDNLVTSFPRITDFDRVLLHITEAGFVPDTAIGVYQPLTGSITGLTWAPDDATTFSAYWDLEGNSVVGGTYSSVVPGTTFPLRAQIVNGMLTPLPSGLPVGFAQGSSGLLFVTDSNGNGFGAWKKLGGAFEAGLVLNDGSSAAFGTPTPFDVSFADGVFEDLLIATAAKNDNSPAQSFFRKAAPGSPWMPLNALTAADSGWTDMTVATVTGISIVGTGTRNGVRTGFLIVPEALGATTTATLTQSADIVRPGTSVQVTFNFPNDSTKPVSAAKITLSDPVAGSFAPGPTGSKLRDSGKSLLIPLAAGQTQVVVTVNTPTTLDWDRDVRLTASTSATADPFVPASFVVNYITVDKP